MKTQGDEKIKSDLGEFLVLQQYAPNTQGEQKQLKKLYLESVSETLYQQMVGLENEAKTTKMESGGELSKKKTALYDTLRETQDKLGDIIPELEQQDENDDQLISAKDKKKFTKFKKEMLNFIARITGISKKILKKSIEANMVDKLNKSRWDVINTDIVVDDKNYTSTQIPASKMQCNLDNDVKPIFTDYGRGGISSLDTKNTDHATNLWSSKLVHKGKELFSALRFGVCCPYGIKNPQKLQDGAQNKAKEVLVASLAQNELIQQAVNAGNNDGTPPTLEICSISLLTTGLGSGKERKMQKTQNEAFKYFEGKQPVEITITDPDGKPQKVKFYLKANLMNLPVNFGGVGFASRFTSGKKAQLKQNTPVMEHFFGKKDNNTTATTGVVDKYQDKIHEELKEKTKRMIN
ncbi:MAG: hypothetical protein OXC48_04345, partial [Endozoicomonadaceae bacterium]|nr:hypothetical protein [Endozoicomonadaceae bacterium]